MLHAELPLAGDVSNVIGNVTESSTDRGDVKKISDRRIIAGARFDSFSPAVPVAATGGHLPGGRSHPVRGIEEDVASGA